MKVKVLSLGLFSAAAVLPLFMPSLTPSAHALGCVATDVGVQVNISSSPSRAQQSNNVNQQFGQNCKGSSVTNTGTQVNVGANSANQNRNSSQFVGSGAPGDDGIGNVRTSTPVAVDVKIPDVKKLVPRK
ncbi:MAG: hypothetical protein ACHBN1_31715 [Heteroscytonema crispum UTEX LB 1556]